MGTGPLIAVTGSDLAAGRVVRWPQAAVAVQQPYLAALARAGATPVVLAPADLDQASASELLARFDGLVLTGGPDVDPARYGQEPRPETYGVDATADAFAIALCRAALADRVPTLAICRGIQVLNVALGGTLDQHLSAEGRPGLGDHGRPGVEGGAARHTVIVEEGSLLAEAMGTTAPVCSCHHHQAIDRLADGLRVTARAADGVVEGVEMDGAWLLAVQWHPEDTAGTDPAQQGLFDALVARAV